MAEKDQIFSSKVKYNGIVSFKDFYKFCYDWLTEETGIYVAETKYLEKLKGNSKDIDIEWAGTRKVTDYFKFQIKAKFRILGLIDIETTQQGVKIRTNKSSVEIKVTGTLVRDYEGKFEITGYKKFLRSIYEKYGVLKEGVRIN